MTGFEIHRTYRPVKKINHLRMQIAAKSSKIYANPQPGATKILVKDRLREHSVCPSPPSPSHYTEGQNRQPEFTLYQRP